jgi:hypothetical protein
MKSLLGDFNVTVGESIFNPAIRNESLHQGIKDNGVKIVNSDTSKILVVRSTICVHQIIHRYTRTWTSPDGKTHNQISHVDRQEMAFEYMI